MNTVPARSRGVLPLFPDRACVQTHYSRHGWRLPFWGPRPQPPWPSLCRAFNGPSSNCPDRLDWDRRPALLWSASIPSMLPSFFISWGKSVHTYTHTQHTQHTNIQTREHKTQKHHTPDTQVTLASMQAGKQASKSPPSGDVRAGARGRPSDCRPGPLRLHASCRQPPAGPPLRCGYKSP